MLVAVLAAAITFGSLYAIAGEKYFGKYANRGECRRHFSNMTEGKDWHLHSERPAIERDAVRPER